MSSQLDAFHQSVYEQSFEEIRTLNNRLPEDMIISLAREVLRRVSDRASEVTTASSRPVAEQVDKLARALISDDPNAGADIVKSLRADGTSLDDVYLLHLAEASRKLGIWWETDRISLVDVTVGTGRIYAIMRGLSRLFPFNDGSGKKSAMFTSVPGETHTIGVKMAADLFRKNGWDIDLKLGATAAQLADDIRATKPRIVGLSAGGAHATDDLALLIVAIRINSPATAVLVSGQIVNEAGDMVKLMGPDSIVFDFNDVEAEMDRLWQMTDPVRAS